MKHDEEKFVEKRMFAIPTETFVELELSEEDVSKTREWVNNSDIIGIFPYAKGSRLVLVNHTKLEKWKRRKET